MQVTLTMCVNERFENWIKWQDRERSAKVKLPGVYVCAITEDDISGTEFSWRRDIVYVGMTNSIAGLKGRLKQFDSTIAGRHVSHGGADRMKFKHPNYEDLCSKLFVSILPFECDVRSNAPKDLRVMGAVVKREYECLAEYAERFCNRLPEFNYKDNKKAPKYSRRHKSNH